VTWQAAGPGVRLGGGLRLPPGSLTWKPWGKVTEGSTFVADIGAALPPQVRQAIRNVAAASAKRTITSETGSNSSVASAAAEGKQQGQWDYGLPPPLINQLFVNNARQILARYPNGDPEASSGLCFQGPELPSEGCGSWLIPDGGVKAKQPSGHSYNKINNYPDCETKFCVNRGLSPTWGCDECHTCGTFGPYFVNDPPPNHPLYGDPAKPLVYGWSNNSVQSFWSDIFSRPGGVTSYAATNRSVGWSQPETGIVHMFHGALWGWWAFNIASIEQSEAAGPQINFGYGGHQEARGWSVTEKSAFYVENILEEMDQPGEWYFEQDKLLLYLIPNTTAGQTIDTVDLSLPVLNTLISVASNRSTPQAERVRDVSFIGFEFSQTRSTFMSEPYEVPSAGDWSVHRGGAVFIEAAHNITIKRCLFNQTGGNAILLSGSVTDSAVVENEFERIGDSAIVLLGAAEIEDGTKPTYPNRNMIARNHVHDYGVYGKQVSAVFQALSSNTTITDCVVHGGPRAHINLNDGFSGNTVLEGNLLFASVRETADHGPVNTWNRMPYWTLNGVDDGFEGDTWANITKPAKGASAVKDFDHIRRNFVLTDYGGSRALDHDDGSQFFRDEENVLVGSGVKNFLGNTKHFVGNLIIGAGEKGICCYQSDGSNGHSNHVFANNTCIYGANRTDGGETLCLAHTGMPYVLTPGLVQPYRRTLHCTPNTTKLGSPAFREWMQNSSFAANDNTYHSEGGDGRYHLRENAPGCLDYDLSLEQVQAMTGEETGSTQGAAPSVAEVVAMARELLRMPPAQLPDLDDAGRKSQQRATTDSDGSSDDETSDSGPLACQPNTEQPMLPIFHIIGNVTKSSSGNITLEPINDCSGVTFHEGLYHMWHQCCQNHWCVRPSPSFLNFELLCLSNLRTTTPMLRASADDCFI
jgi:hypothetical protein